MGQLLGVKYNNPIKSGFGFFHPFQHSQDSHTHTMRKKRVKIESGNYSIYPRMPTVAAWGNSELLHAMVYLNLDATAASLQKTTKLLLDSFFL